MNGSVMIIQHYAYILIFSICFALVQFRRLTVALTEGLERASNSAKQGAGSQELTEEVARQDGDADFGGSRNGEGKLNQQKKVEKR